MKAIIVGCCIIIGSVFGFASTSGADTTQTPGAWYAHYGKSQVAGFKKDIKEIRHDVKSNEPIDLDLDCGGLKFDSNAALIDPRIDDDILQAEWAVIITSFHKAGTSCVKSLNDNSVKQAKLFVKNLHDGINLMNKFVNQSKGWV